MSHLSSTEAVQCVDHMYEFLFGHSNYRRWCSLKESLNLPLESSFVTYMLDVVELHRDAMCMQDNGNIFSKGDDSDGVSCALADHDSSDGLMISDADAAALLSSAAAAAVSSEPAAAPAMPDASRSVLPATGPATVDSDGEASMSHLLPPPPPLSFMSSASTTPAMTNGSGLPHAIFEERAIEHIDLNDSNDAVDATFRTGGSEEQNNFSSWLVSHHTGASSERAVEQEVKPVPEFTSPFAKMFTVTSNDNSATQITSIISSIRAQLEGVAAGGEPPDLSGHTSPPHVSTATQVHMLPMQPVSIIPSQLLGPIQLTGSDGLIPAVDITGRRGNCCPICQKCVRNRSYLKTHLNTVHFGQKPHQCEYCKARFTRISTLKQHVRAVHLHVKQHKCEHCEQNFSKASNLRSHIKSVHLHRRKHLCNVCGIACSNKKKRLEHEKRHT